MIQKEKFLIGKEIGYIPFFNTLGMQIVVVAKNIIETKTARPVDTLNNFRTIIQSFSVIDITNEKYYKSITWGQSVSEPIQKSIDHTIIHEFFGSL